MRHKKAGKKLNMSSPLRKAMFRNMAKSLITHEAIRTTETRAKELRKIVERLVTYAIKNDVAARRQAYKVLNNHGLVKRLFDEIGPRYASGGGGYTRVIKLGAVRTGDAAPMAIIEFTKKAGEVAQPEEKPAKKAAPKKAAPKKAAPKAEEKPAAKAEESPAEEVKPEKTEE